MYIESDIPLAQDEDVIQLIDVVSAQAAISLRNARVYSDMEEQVHTRTRELRNLNKDLEKRVVKQVDEITSLSNLKRFLSPQVTELVVGRDSELLTSHRREIAIVFCDLRGFTAFSDSVEPEEAMDMLTEYHTELGKLFSNFHATIDHRAGDGLMVFLNDPIPLDDPINDAVKMAMQMRDRVNVLIQRWGDRGHEIGFGVGISYGFSTIGLVGYEENYDYSATGRYVSLASRLCDEAENGQILITKRIVSDLSGDCEPMHLRRIELKGFSKPEDVYQI